MDRWQLWRRVWFRMNRKTHSRRQYAVATRTRSDPEGRRSVAPPARYLLGQQHFAFVRTMAAGITQRPKVLLDVDCSNLLMGGSNQYENFSSTCWLEDHLHRFGGPVSPSRGDSNAVVSSSYEFHGATELEASTGSVVMGDSFEDYSADSSEESDENMPSTSGFGQNHGGNNTGNVINLHRYPYVDHETAVPEPPPYEDEPPPSYEEAIAGNSSFAEISNNDNTDFLW